MSIWMILRTGDSPIPRFISGGLGSAERRSLNDRLWPGQKKSEVLAAGTAPRHSSVQRQRQLRSMKIATFNINDVNKRLANLLEWLGAAKPDVVCLQELKATDAEFPKAE